MESWFTTELEPIYRAPLFVSSDAEEVKRRTAGALKEHALHWRCGTVDAALYRTEVGALSFIVLQYGAAVRIETEALGFMLFQVPLEGSAHACVDGQALALSPRTGALISPHGSLALDWHAGCRQLLVKIPRERVEHACRLLIDDEVAQPLAFAPEMPLDGDVGRGWQHQIASQLSAVPAACEGIAFRLLPAQEEALLHYLLLRQQSNYAARIARPARAAAPRSVRQAQQYIRAHLLDSLTLESIARASGASVRGLCQAFQQSLQCAPMAYVRQLRLERARQQLLDAPAGTQVTDVALRCGFNHTGRFSMAYRSRYGESPLQTLRGR